MACFTRQTGNVRQLTPVWTQCLNRQTGKCSLTDACLTTMFEMANRKLFAYWLQFDHNVWTGKQEIVCLLTPVWPPCLNRQTGQCSPIDSCLTTRFQQANRKIFDYWLLFDHNIWTDKQESVRLLTLIWLQCLNRQTGKCSFIDSCLTTMFEQAHRKVLVDWLLFDHNVWTGKQDNDRLFIHVWQCLNRQTRKCSSIDTCLTTMFEQAYRKVFVYWLLFDRNFWTGKQENVELTRIKQDVTAHLDAVLVYTPVGFVRHPHGGVQGVRCPIVMPGNITWNIKDILQMLSIKNPGSTKW